ncbi:MAG: hypothetical protein NTZ26_11540 [Candidatus Aminicenantes bacterium]|nr:hypothetical protein [Candidatus Aminicenantes bacterium]
MKRCIALAAAVILLAGFPFAQTLGNNKKIAHVTGGVRWSQCAFGPEGVLHVCFEEDSDRGHPIWYVNYDGTTASTPFNVTGSLDIRGERPGIAVSSHGVVAVAWGVDAGDSIFVRIYDPKTKAWGAIDSIAPGYGWGEPQLAIESDGTVHCFFSNDDQGRTYCSTRTNGVWGSAVRLSSGYAKQGGVAVGPNNKAWALWREKGGGGVYKNYYASRPHGGTWSGADLVTSSGGSSSHPSITVGPDSVAIGVWGDIDINNETGAEIRLIKLVSGAVREIAIPFAMQHYPRAVVDPNLKIHVAAQIGGGDFGSGAVYANNVTGSWSSPQQCLTSMDKVVGLSSDPYGNVGICLSDMLTDGKGSDIYIWTTQAIIPRFIYPPQSVAAAISLKNVRRSPGITYNLTWTANPANTDAWITGYNVYMQENGGAYQLLLNVNKATLNATFTFSDLTKKRRFAITTVNPAGGESDLIEF